MKRTRERFDFCEALRRIKTGATVRRSDWAATGMYVFLVHGSRFQVSRAPLSLMYPEGTWITYHTHIDLRTAEGWIVPWSATQMDLLADDWENAE